jgi:ribonuclease E
MSKTMLVNVTHVEESRVAILQDGVLDAYEIETINRAQIKGNIYNAVIENVHPTLEAAFLKISPELKGFLPLDEVNFSLLPARSESRKSGKIGQHLHQGQKIMAQVVREPYAGKPPTVSTYFSLPGRYLVLMPGVESAGVSRKIENEEHRERLRQIVHELQPPEGFGLIVRTAGLGQTKSELQRDLRYLLRLWQSIQLASKTNEFPGIVYHEADLVIRTMRDHLSSDIDEVWIDSQETYDKTHEFVRRVMPTRAKTLRLYSGTRPLFNKYNLEEQIESIYKRRVALPSGGEIVIDGTEALTAIDVNSARSKRKGDAEETVLKTNLEAAAEIARQLRLRDLAGLIVVDFIDMATAKNRKKVEDAMREAMRSDRAKHDITRLSKLGLMEIARQRLRGAKIVAMYTACPTCEGYGLIKNVEVAALAALRKLQTRSSRSDVGRIRVGLPVDVATWMLNNKRHDLVEIERRQNLRIDIVPVKSLLRHEVEFESLQREKADVPVARTVGDRVPPAVPPTVPPSEPEAEKPAPAADSGADASAPAGPAPFVSPSPQAEPEPRKRRRRRRRGPAESGASEGEKPAKDREAGGGEPSSSNVVPFERQDGQPPVDDPPADPSVDAPADSASPVKSEASDTEDERPRRRKRRRRSRRGGDSSGDSAKAAPNKTADDEVPTVPRGVHSHELMPAAVGGRSRSGKPTSKAPRRRRRGPARRSDGGGRGKDGDDR